MISFKNIKLSSIWGKDDLFVTSIKQLTGFKPKNTDLYRIAFTHKSEIKHAKDGSVLNYERMEFLGDSLLDASITAFLYHKLPNSSEGQLTQMRAKIVSREHLNEIGKDLNLVSFSKKPESKRKYSYHAYGDLFEALIGAIFLDRGYDVMDKFVQKKLIEPYVDIEKLEGKVTSYKSLIIEWCQKKHYPYQFQAYDDGGKEHEKYFVVKLFVNEKQISKGRSTSKKKAEEIASKRAYYSLQNSNDFQTIFPVENKKN